MQAPYSYRDDPAVPAFPDDKPVIVFDGYCALCSGSAQFVLRHDPEGRFRLLAAQSALGQALYVHYGLDPNNYETMILIANGVARVKSDGAIDIAAGLGFPWSLASLLRVIPRMVRDPLYNLIARNRLHLFGTRETCFRPDPRHEGRFLA